MICVDPEEETLRSTPRDAEIRALRLSSDLDSEIDSLTPFTNVESAAEWCPDYILVDGHVHFVRDIQALLCEVQRVCSKHTRLILVTYSTLWRPLLEFATLLGARRKTPLENWLAPGDIVNFATLAGLGIVQSEPKILLPVYVPLLSRLVNRWIAPLPFWRMFCLVNITIPRARTQERLSPPPLVSIVVPARDEAGNIQPLFERIPPMGSRDEIILVEGHAEDDTWRAMQRCSEIYNCTR